ncbi:MAG: histidinol phosphate phosphatase domain-containing protein [Nitrospinae bacterium]|nr:histidinol phosphate phosphatase domain-containing protein [Nitrospinota bacterium]
MIDLHMHSVFSDGELIPAELARRAEMAGCRCIAITDHVDQSNVEQVVTAIVKFCSQDGHKVKVLPGVEITHVTPGNIADVAKRARANGAKIIAVHGETIVEPVEKETNEAAIDAGVTFIAHPGMITPEVAAKAASAGVCLEISGRHGHSYSNGHVANVARQVGAKLIFNTDTHSPRNIVDRESAIRIVMAAGLSFTEAQEVLGNSQKIVEACCGSL